MVLISLSAFSNSKEEKVPNELIVNNPKKEVTTVESPKNREHGEMNISVTKINPIEIVGREVNGKLEFNLPEKVNSDNKILVTQDVSHIQGLVKLNGKEPRNLLGKKKIELPVPFTLEKKYEKTKVIVDKPKDKKDLYIAVMNGGKVEKVYRQIQRSKYLGEIMFELDPRFAEYVKMLPNQEDILIDQYGNMIDESANTIKKIYMLDEFIKVQKNPFANDDRYQLDPPNEEPYVKLSGGQRLDYRQWGGELSKYYRYSIGRSNYILMIYYDEEILATLSRNIAFNPSYVSTTNIVTDTFIYNFPLQIKAPQWNTFERAELKISIHVLPNNNHMLSESDQNTFYIDLTAVPKNEPIFWKNNEYFTANRNRPSTNYSNVVMKGGGDLSTRLNWRSLFTKNFIAKKIKITAYNSKKEEIESREAINSLHVGMTHNDFYFDSSGLRIIKKTDNKEEIKYKVELFGPEFYNDFIPLGVNYFKITNKGTPTQTNIGTVTFKVDKRLKNLENKGSWLFANGELADGIKGNSQNYSEMLKLEGDFSNISNVKIKSIEGIEGRINSHSSERNNIKYQIFKTSESDVWLDESAMPYGDNISLSNLKNNLVISKYNSSNSLLLNNKFTLKDSNNNFYKGNVLERYEGEEAKITEATVDLTSWNAKNSDWGRWDNSTISNTTAGKHAKLEGGLFFNWKSSIKNIGNGHIVTKLRIKEADNSFKEITNDVINQRAEFNFENNIIGIDSNGGIFIHKKTDSINPITYIIEGYYKDVLLGKTTLTVINNKASISIEGNNTLDFGNMIYDPYNSMYKEEELFKVNNPEKLNLRFSVKETGTIVKNDESSKKIDLENIKVSKQESKIQGETLFLLEACARIKQDTSPGNYIGEIQIIVDIDGTGANKK